MNDDQDHDTFEADDGHEKITNIEMDLFKKSSTALHELTETQRKDSAEIQTKILQGCFDNKLVARYHRQMNEAEKLEFHKRMMDSNSLDWHPANNVSRETQMTNRALGERTSE